MSSLARLSAIGVSIAALAHGPSLGCAARPLTPAEVARERVALLRERGADLTPEQVRLLRRVPYANRDATQRRIDGILSDPEGASLEATQEPGGDAASPDRWRRFRVSSLIEDEKRDETNASQREDDEP
ncbi:MAG: hypothetical protein AB7O52_01975 [Planctomycetota bacterium]